MNMSDARLIGASALTAAAVALATVVVYEGYVRVSSGGQTVTVQPGATVELRHDQPPAPPPVVGVNTDDRIRVLEQEVERLRELQRTVPGATVPHAESDDAELSRLKPDLVACATKLGFTSFAMTFTVHAATIDLTVEDSGGGNDEAALLGCIKDVLAHGHFSSAQLSYGWLEPATSVPDALGRTEISEAMKRAKVEIDKCAVQTGGTVKAHVRVGADGHVTTVDVVTTPDPALGTCVAKAIQATQFAVTKQGGSFSYPFVFAISEKSCDEVSCVLNNYEGTCCAKFRACDADALTRKGLELESVGAHAAALGELELSLKCKPDDHVIQYAFMASCNANNASRARLYWRKLTLDGQQRLKQMCIRMGITEDRLNGS